MNNYVVQPKPTREFQAPQKSAKPQSGAVSPPGSPVPSTSSSPRTPSHDEIARRAYDIYLKTGSKQGRCKQNWLQAENELRKPVVTAGAPRLSGTSVAARAGSEPGVKTIAGAAPSFLGGRGLTGGSTSPVVQGGRHSKN